MQNIIGEMQKNKKNWVYLQNWCKSSKVKIWGSIAKLHQKVKIWKNLGLFAKLVQSMKSEILRKKKYITKKKNENRILIKNDRYFGKFVGLLFYNFVRYCVWWRALSDSLSFDTQNGFDEKKNFNKLMSINADPISSWQPN